jgi:large subunit ribosomal protein L22|tara:strand:+ start:428 stop:781 length:354 start_codon:yes stop_codon:yes gene_type:complete
MIMESQAKLRLARVSPRKARLVADLIRGREVGEALEILQFTRKKTAPLLKSLVESAMANAEYKANRDGGKIDIDDLVVKQVYVDEGPTLRRFRPRARGSANKILKRTSHITVVLGEA